MIAPSFGIAYATDDRLRRRRAAVARLQHVAAPAERDADLAGGEIVDVGGRVEFPHIGTDFRQRLLDDLEILQFFAVRIEPLVDRHRTEDVRRRIQNRDAAFRELLRVRRIEQDRGPAVDRVGAERSLDQLRVVAEADRAPEVGDRVLVAGIVRGDALHDFRVHVRKFGSFDLSSCRNTPALICRSRNGAVGTTMS